jgi:hypothetical protein
VFSGGILIHDLMHGKGAASFEILSSFTGLRVAEKQQCG